MPEPSEEKQVVWSAALQNFTDRETGQIVSRLEGLSHLHETIVGGAVRFADDLNRLVPNIPDLIPHQFQTPGLEVLRESKISGVDPYEVKPAPNSGYTTLFTYLDSDGNLHVGLKRFAIGRTVDDEVEKAKIVAQIGDDLEIDPTSEEGGSGNIEPLIVSMFHFVTE